MLINHVAILYLTSSSELACNIACQLTAAPATAAATNTFGGNGLMLTIAASRILPDVSIAVIVAVYVMGAAVNTVVMAIVKTVAIPCMTLTISSTAAAGRMEAGLISLVVVLLPLLMAGLGPLLLLIGISQLILGAPVVAISQLILGAPVVVISQLILGASMVAIGQLVLDGRPQL